MNNILPGIVESIKASDLYPVMVAHMKMQGALDIRWAWICGAIVATCLLAILFANSKKGHDVLSYDARNAVTAAGIVVGITALPCALGNLSNGWHRLNEPEYEAFKYILNQIGGFIGR